MTFNFNIYETLAIAIVILLVGDFLKKRISVLERFFIPEPVIGGVLFSIILLIGHNTELFNFTFDGTLKTFLMEQSIQYQSKWWTHKAIALT